MKKSFFCRLDLVCLARVTLGNQVYTGSFLEERMLVLSRRVLEEIVINSNIKVTVCEINGNQVRIGVEAPSNVSILRGELLNHGGNSDD